MKLRRKRSLSRSKLRREPTPAPGTPRDRRQQADRRIEPPPQLGGANRQLIARGLAAVAQVEAPPAPKPLAVPQQGVTPALALAADQVQAPAAPGILPSNLDPLVLTGNAQCDLAREGGPCGEQVCGEQVKFRAWPGALAREVRNIIIPAAR